MVETERIVALRERFGELSGILARGAQELDDLEDQRVAVLESRIGARGKQRETLAEEFGRLDARARLAAAEVETLRELRGGVFRDLREAEVEAARSELAVYLRDVHQPIKARLDDWTAELRILLNHGRGTELTLSMPVSRIEKVGAARVEVARATADLQVSAVRYRELQRAVELAAAAVDDALPDEFLGYGPEPGCEAGDVGA